MIKGCQRRIIMVKETGSSYFECAYFVLRSDLTPSAREGDMLAEARRMIDACIPIGEVTLPPPEKKKPRISRTAAIVLTVAVLSVSAVLLALLL